MINSIRNLYQAQDLTGESLVAPLKNYRSFFVKKIAESSGLTKIAWRIAHVVSGLFAYPALGLIAGLGLFVKLTGVPGVRKHNRDQKSYLETIRTGIQYAKVFSTDSNLFSISQAGWRMDVAKTVQIAHHNAALQIKKIEKEIDLLTGQFRKVYVKSQGTIIEGTGDISIQLRVRVKE